MRRIEWRRPMFVWQKRERNAGAGARRAEGKMSGPERAGERRRGGGRAESGGDGSREPAPRREAAGDPQRERRAGRSEGGSDQRPERCFDKGPDQSRPRGDSHPRSAQLVFVTPFGVPIGPSVQEELAIPTDLDDTLPPGDLPGQLLLDLGLG